MNTEEARRAYNAISASRKYLSRREYLTLRGLVSAGDAEGAIKGLKKILGRGM